MATIKVIRTDEEFLALKPEWDALVAQNPEARVFQTFDWNYSGWMHYHRRHFPESKLFVLHVTRDGHADQRAIVPGCIFPDGRYELLMQMISDVVDIIEPPHSDNWHNFYADIVNFLKETPEVKRLFVFHLLPTSNFLRYAGVYYDRVRITRMDAFSYLPVKQTADFAGSLLHLTSKERSYVRSLGKKQTGGTYKLYSKATGDAFPKEALRSLRDWMCEHGVRQYSFFPDETLDFISAVYDCGKCDVSALVDESGALIEASFRVYAGSHVNFWVVLYREAYMTTLVDCRYMQDRAAMGDCVFDFGTGAYEYKLGTFRPEVEHLYVLESYRLTLRHLFSECKEALRQYVKGLLGRM